MKYSKRVTAITELIDNCKCLCDVGCDHGYVCIISCENGKAEKAIASDINRGPLSKASVNIENAGLSERIKTVLSNGFKNIEDVFDSVCICGMGGLLIRDILNDGKEKLKNVRQMILGPHSELYSLRKYIFEETPFKIISETVLFEDGKFYSLLDVRKKEDIPALPETNEAFLNFGNPYIQKDPESYKKMLNHERNKRTDALNEISSGNGSEKAILRKAELLNEISHIDSIIKIIGE